MAWNSLTEFVKALDMAGELVRVRAEVDPALEITEICDRVVKARGPALLFENVKGSRFPLLINAFGSPRRVELALGRKPDEIADEIRKLIQLKPPAGFFEKIKMLPLLGRLAKVPPKLVRSGPCQEVVKTEDFDVRELPIIKCWPEDGGRTITLPLVITKSPVDGRRNVGMYRLQVYDGRTLHFHSHIHHDAARHVREAKAQGVKGMEVAVAIGAPPELTYAATAPLPPEIDEMLFAGFIRGQGVEMVKCKTVDLEVPAAAEFVIEGYVDPDDMRTEGPFGDHTGYYSLADEYPMLHITAITHRREAIYQTIVVGAPPMEDTHLGKATERIFLPMIQMILPEVIDFNFPEFGIFHNFVMVRIKKQYPMHAHKVMHAIWGLGQMMFSKFIVVVDEHVDVQDEQQVFFTLANCVDPRRDICIVDGPVDVLDHAGPRPNVGSKMGIDATHKWPEEGYDRVWPERILMSDEMKQQVEQRWEELGITLSEGRKWNPYR